MPYTPTLHAPPLIKLSFQSLTPQTLRCLCPCPQKARSADAVQRECARRPPLAGQAEGGQLRLRLRLRLRLQSAFCICICICTCATSGGGFYAYQTSSTPDRAPRDESRPIANSRTAHGLTGRSHGRNWAVGARAAAGYDRLADRWPVCIPNSKPLSSTDARRQTHKTCKTCKTCKLYKPHKLRKRWQTQRPIR